MFIIQWFILETEVYNTKHYYTLLHMFPTVIISLAVVMAVLRLTASDYPLGIFKIFINLVISRSNSLFVHRDISESYI